MSKILFWSPYHGQGQTSNLHIIALIMGLLHKKSVLMMQTHFKNNNLEAPLVGHNVDKYDEKCELFDGIGLDMAITYSNMGRLGRKELESCCLTFQNTSILLMPGTETKDRETYERDIGGSIYRMLHAAEEAVDIILIDSNSGEDTLSMKLMPIADLIVVNLTQRRYVLDQFISQYGERFLGSKKVYYLFGDYDDNSIYNINNCRRKYKHYINGSNSGVIPYCTGYMDSQNESKVIRFIQEGLKSQRVSIFQNLLINSRLCLKKQVDEKEESQYFFHRARLSVEKMFDLLHLHVRKELREGYHP